MVIRRSQDTKLGHGLRSEEVGWLMKEKDSMLTKLVDIEEVKLPFYVIGIPVESRGRRRGESIGIPGEYHDPMFHNEKLDPLRSE